MTVQSKFDLVLPTTDNATPPNALAAGQITSLAFVVTSGSAPATTYTCPMPASTPAGAAVSIPFIALAPPFVPAAGQTYSADVYAVDANGNGLPSASITWVQAAVPAAPTGFGVA